LTHCKSRTNTFPDGAVIKNQSNRQGKGLALVLDDFPRLPDMAKD
jgi:hypothetical protein